MPQTAYPKVSSSIKGISEELSEILCTVSVTVSLNLHCWHSTGLSQEKMVLSRRKVSGHVSFIGTF